MGYCQMWIFFVMETILLNPTRDTKEIIQICLENAQSSPERFRMVIRGYLQHISEHLKQHFSGLQQSIGPEDATAEYENFNKDTYVYRTIQQTRKMQQAQKAQLDVEIADTSHEAVDLQKEEM